MIRKQQVSLLSPTKNRRQSASIRSSDVLSTKDKNNQRIKVHNYKQANGSVYTGQLLHGKFDGKGQLIYADKQKYNGQFVKGMKHGFGKYYYKSGQYYIGEWFQNKKEGKGIYFYSNCIRNQGVRYEGEFKNNKKNGKGKIIEDNGNYYQGQFYQNQKDKQGYYHDLQQNKIFKFIFDKGKQIASAQIVQMPDLKSQKLLQSPAVQQGSIPEFLICDPNRIIQEIMSGFVDQNLKTEKSLFASSLEKYASEYKEVDSLYQNPFSRNQFNSENKAEKLSLKSEQLRYKRVDLWDMDDVCEWLGEIYFSDYQSEFRFQKITGFSLLVLTKDDLKELNIVNSSDRQILMREIKFLQMFFKLQCLGDRAVKLQYLDLTIELIKKVSEKQEQIDRKKSQEAKIPEKIEEKPALSIQNNNQESDNDSSSSSSSSSSSQQAKQINLIQQKPKIQKQGLYKWERKKRAKMTMQRKIQAIMKKKGIDFKIVIPRQQVQINKTIGKGGYGQVFLATWMGQNVAVKRYRKKKGFRNRHIGHFLEQAEIINKLSHPNIVLFMGMFIYSNQYAIVMEYLSGGSLFDYLHKKGFKPTYTRIFNICKDIALGMSYLHGKNIMHCDLKSSNVLIDENWTVKISDFGLSQIKNIKKPKHFKGTKLGTPQWMAPQVMRGQKYQFASDVYSFGIIIWQLLTSKIPYRNFTQKQIIQKVAKTSFIQAPQQNQQNQLFLGLFKSCTERQVSKRVTFQQIVDILQQQQFKFMPNKLIKNNSKTKE